MPSAGSLGEDGLIAGVIGAFARAGTPPGWLNVGPGDDAAVIDWAALTGGSGGQKTLGALVASTDTLVEGADFRRGWSSPADVGVKTAAQNFADIAAMGARPAVLLVSLALPSAADAGFAAGLAAGIAQECARAGAVVAGGDFSAATEIVVTGTALGVLPAGVAPVLRSGARPGDVVAVAGELGRSAAGWALLEQLVPGTEAGAVIEGTADAALARLPGEALKTLFTGLIGAHRRPRPPYPAGPAAASGGATALIDTSDGLIRDAARIAAASGVTIDLDAARLSPDADLRRAAEFLGQPDLARRWVLTGGEDHCLLATFPPEAGLPAGFARIGAVRARGDGPGDQPADQPAGGRADVLVDGQPWTGSPGWRHFDADPAGTR